MVLNILRVKNKSLVQTCRLFLISVCALGSFAQAQNNPQVGVFETVSLIGQINAQRTYLENGLRIFVVEDHTSPTLAYYTYFDVGSRAEVKGKTGLAHMFEHMMFRGTKKYPGTGFRDKTTQIGAFEVNAETQTQLTKYQQEVPASQLETIIDLESDRMANLVVDQKTFETEREAVKEELRADMESSPEGPVWEKLYGDAFQTNSRNWLTIGHKEDLDAETGDDAKDFFKRNYAPDNATVIVVGDVKPADVYQKINQYYGKIPAAKQPHFQVTPEPEQTQQRRDAVHGNFENEMFLAGYQIPAVSNAYSPALNVLSMILAGNENSRLNQALVETGIATAVSAGPSAAQEKDLFLVEVYANHGHTAAEAEAVLNKVLAKLQTDLVTDAELEATKSHIQLGIRENFLKHTDIADFLGTAQIINRSPENAITFQDAMLTVTKEDIQNVARKYLLQSNETMIYGLPKAEGTK